MTRIQIRRGTAAQWTAANPTLFEGELAYEVDTFKVKIGNGITAWNSLSYVSLDWATLSGKPDYLAAGSTAADACAAIGAEQTSAKGQANGYASLDGGGKVPASQLPASLMAYLGVWNASTNSPSLADGAGDPGDVYRVGTAGSQDLGGGSITFDVGDYVIYNGTRWEKSDTTDAVSSVNGLTGIVSITKSDLGLGNVDNTSDATKNSATATLTNKTIDGADNTLIGIELNSLATTGTANNTTYLRGDGAWATVAAAQDWSTLTGKPAVVAAGDTKADARTAIDAEYTGNKGQPGGYASLDSSGYIPLSQWGAQVVNGGSADATAVDIIDGGTA